MPKIYVVQSTAADARPKVFYRRKDADKEQALQLAKGRGSSILPLTVDPTKMPRRKLADTMDAMDWWPSDAYAPNDALESIMMAFDYIRSTNEIDVIKRGNALMRAMDELNDMSNSLTSIAMMAVAGADNDTIMAILEDIFSKETLEQLRTRIEQGREEALHGPPRTIEEVLNAPFLQGKTVH